jgi:hypothetical protein
VSAALAGPDASASQALAGDADVRRAVAITLEQARLIPTEVGTSDWALVQAVDPEAGRRLAAAIDGDEVGRLARKAWLLLHPLSPAGVLAAAWERQALGDASGSRALLSEAEARGVPLPFGE